MKKLFLLLLLTSCGGTYKKYTVEVEKCNGEKIIVITHEYIKPYIDTYKEAVPVFYGDDEKIINVCDIKILKVE